MNQMQLIKHKKIIWTPEEVVYFPQKLNEYIPSKYNEVQLSKRNPSKSRYIRSFIGSSGQPKSSL